MRIKIEDPNTAKVEDIKKKVKERSGMHLVDVELCDLWVWRIVGKMTLNTSNWEDILPLIKVNEKNTIKALQEGVKVLELRLSDYEVLLVQVISMLHVSTASKTLPDDIIKKHVDHQDIAVDDEGPVDKVRALKEFNHTFNLLYLIRCDLDGG